MSLRLHCTIGGRDAKVEVMAKGKTTQLERVVLGILAGCFVGVLVILPVHAFLSTWGGTAIGPLLVWKSWKELLLLLLVPLVVWLCVLRPDITRTVWRDKLNKIVLAYVVLTLVMAVLSRADTDAVLAGLLMNLRFFAMFVLAQVIAASGAPWVEPLKKWLVGWLLATGAALAALAILQVTVIPKDFLAQFGYNKDATIAPYILVDQNPNALRAFATMRGPNTLGAYLLLPLAVSLVLWWQKRKTWLLVVAAGITVALALTGSRSAWLGTLATVLVLGWTVLPRKPLLHWLKVGAVPAVLVVAALLWLATTVPALRLAVFHSGGDNSAEALTEGSTAKHWEATVGGLQHIVAYPFGDGVGAAGPASFYNHGQPPSIPENYFVQIGQEVGVAGLTLFIIVQIIVWRRLWAQKTLLPRVLLASFAGITVINLFLHGWADDPTAMTWWGLAGLFIAARQGKKVQLK